MNKSISKDVSLLISVVLLFEIVPAPARAATDNLMRFQMNSTGESAVIAAVYGGTAYVMGGERDGGGRLAVPANGYYSAEDEWGGSYEFIDIRQSGSPTLFTVDANVTQNYEFFYSFSDNGQRYLKPDAEGAIGFTLPGETPYYWKD